VPRRARPGIGRICGTLEARSGSVDMILIS
jgi:hypothetical protein